MKLYHFPEAEEERGPFCRTPAAEDMLRVIETARKLGELGAIIAAPGTGKTTVLEHYAATDPGARYCVMNPAARSMSAMLKTVCQALGAFAGQSCMENFEIACNAMRWGRVSVLLIDEAQHLDDKSLDALRSLHDESGCPIVFAGNRALRERVVKDRAAAFAQLSSRIGARVALDGTTAEDLKVFAAHRGVREPKAVAWLAERCQGVAGLRIAARLLQLAGGGEEIALADLRNAALALGDDG